MWFLITVCRAHPSCRPKACVWSGCSGHAQITSQQGFVKSMMTSTPMLWCFFPPFVSVSYLLPPSPLSRNTNFTQHTTHIFTWATYDEERTNLSTRDLIATTKRPPVLLTSSAWFWLWFEVLCLAFSARGEKKKNRNEKLHFLWTNFPNCSGWDRRF